MTFSQRVKREIIDRQFFKKCEKVCQLCGIIMFNSGMYIDKRGELVFELKVHNPTLTRKIFQLFKDIYDEKILLKKNRTFKSQKESTIYIKFS